jgi:hypothetical protein
MMVVSFDWSNRCFTRFIWQSLEIHDDGKYCMCSLYFNLESSIVPKSVTCDTGSRVFPIKLMLGTWSSCWSNCCDPTTIILVLSGFISKLFLQGAARSYVRRKVWLVYIVRENWVIHPFDNYVTTTVHCFQLRTILNYPYLRNIARSWLGASFSC